MRKADKYLIILMAAILITIMVIFILFLTAHPFVYWRSIIIIGFIIGAILGFVYVENKG